MPGGGFFVLRRLFHRPITTGPRLGEGTSSRLRLTGEQREGYVQILGKDPLIWDKGGK